MNRVAVARAADPKKKQVLQPVVQVRTAVAKTKTRDGRDMLQRAVMGLYPTRPKIAPPKKLMTPKRPAKVGGVVAGSAKPKQTPRTLSRPPEIFRDLLPRDWTAAEQAPQQQAPHTPMVGSRSACLGRGRTVATDVVREIMDQTWGKLMARREDRQEADGLRMELKTSQALLESGLSANKSLQGQVTQTSRQLEETRSKLEAMTLREEDATAKYRVMFEEHAKSQSYVQRVRDYATDLLATTSKKIDAERRRAAHSDAMYQQLASAVLQMSVPLPDAVRTALPSEDSSV